jgi:hypothetical protein
MLNATHNTSEICKKKCLEECLKHYTNFGKTAEKGTKIFVNRTPRGPFIEQLVLTAIHSL